MPWACLLALGILTLGSAEETPKISDTNDSAHKVFEPYDTRPQLLGCILIKCGANPKVLADGPHSPPNYGTRIQSYVFGGAESAYYGPETDTTPTFGLGFYCENFFGFSDFLNDIRFAGAQYYKSSSTGQLASNLETSRSIVLNSGLFIPILEQAAIFPSEISSGPLMFRFGPIVRATYSLAVENRTESGGDALFSYGLGFRGGFSHLAYCDVLVGKNDSLNSARLMIRSWLPLFVLSDKYETRVIFTVDADFKAYNQKNNEDDVFSFGFILSTTTDNIIKFIDGMGD